MTTAVETVAKWGPPTDHPQELWEFIGGQWKETPRLGAFATLLASFLDQELGAFARKLRLGLSMTETLFRLAPKGPARRPDVAFVSWDRWPFTEPLTEDPPAFDIVPNLAVEVNSPTNLADEIIDKAHDYFFAGVQLVWVIYPRQRIIHVHENPEHIRVLRVNQELDGGVVLPGFRLPLAELFNVSSKPV
jgi:Uma2 family endonuclease